MKWLTNIHDPRRADHYMYVVPAHNQTREQYIEQERLYLIGKTIGEPQATEYCSAETMKNLGLVGVYEVEEVSAA